MADESPGTVLAPDALNPQSFLVIENGQAFQKTQAVIVLLKTVGGKWKLIAQFLNLLPGMVTRQTLRLGRGQQIQMVW